MNRTHVETRAIGQTGLAVSVVGVGTASLGNLYREISDVDAHAVIERSLVQGLGYIDTAPLYGFGLSERRVGNALRGRSDYVISTKVGRLLKPDKSVTDNRERAGFHSAMPFTPAFDYRYDAIYRSWEDSLQRLGLNKIDILYIHDIGVRTHGESHPQVYEQLISGGGFKALEELRSRGEIAAFGIGVNETEICREVMEATRIDVILLANRYTLLEPHGLDELAPLCAKKGVSIVIGAPFNSGILATGTTQGVPAHYNYAPASTAVFERVARIEAICQRHEVPLAAAALQFPLGHPQVVSVIPGMGAPGQVGEIAYHYRISLPSEFWRDLKSHELLPNNAFTPGHASSEGAL